MDQHQWAHPEGEGAEIHYLALGRQLRAWSRSTRHKGPPRARAPRNGPALPAGQFSLLALGSFALTFAATMYVAEGSSRYGSVELVFRHLAAAPGCDAVKAVGLAPARRGEAGYWKRHDRNGDGETCDATAAPSGA